MREVRSEGERKVIVTRCVPHEILEVRDTDGEESQMEKNRRWRSNADGEETRMKGKTRMKEETRMEGKTRIKKKRG